MQLLTMRRPSAPAPVFRSTLPTQSQPGPRLPYHQLAAQQRPAVRPWGSTNEPEDPTLPRDIASRFGRRVRELRHARAMTQVEVAVHFGIDRTFISDVERGRKSVCLPTMEVMALGFGVSLSDLLKGL